MHAPGCNRPQKTVYPIRGKNPLAAEANCHDMAVDEGKTHDRESCVGARLRRSSGSVRCKNFLHFNRRPTAECAFDGAAGRFSERSPMIWANSDWR